SDVRTVLASLGALHVRGAAVDWRGVYAGRGYRKIVLPTYPFQRRRFWVGAGAMPQIGHSQGQSRADNGTQHPLIGRRLHLAGSNQIRYESVISSVAPEYLKDHRVFDHVLFPATGYVEMAFAAGQALNHSVLLQDLHLQQPLLVHDNETTTLQCALTPAEAGSYCFEVFSLAQPGAGGNPEWTLHASGKLVAGDGGEGGGPVDLAKLREVCPDELSINAHYQQFEQRGIVYGPAFRTIQGLWRGDHQALAEIRLPDSMLLEASVYRIHPALLDACLQVFGAALSDDGKNVTYLPMGIDSIKVTGQPGGTVWVHVRSRRASTHEPTMRADVIVAGPKGEAIAELQGLILARASRSAFSAINPQQLRRWLCEITWRAQRQHGRRLSPDFLRSPVEIEKQLAKVFPEVLKQYDLERYSPAHARIKRLCLAYIVRALQQLGFAFEPGRRFTVDELAERLTVVPQHRRQFARLISILAEDDVIEAVDDAWVVRIVPDLTDPGADAGGLRKEYPALDGLLSLLIDCGDNMAAMLQANVDPLRIIFPEGSTARASRLYSELPATQAMNEMVRRSIEAAVARIPDSRQLRILEIGAGTGGTTVSLLPHLPADRTQYTYTDISPVFFGAAKERFKDYDFIEFKTLNIELDPANQGFEPHEFDVVVAANVLHATSDLRATVTHAHQLLAPGGMLVLLEGTRPSRPIDLIFGWTDGWWRFTDSGLRDSHPLISPRQWRDVLRDTGFSQVTAFPSIKRTSESGHDLSVILARTNDRPNSDAAGKRQWVIFDDQRETSARLIELLEAQGDRCLRVRVGGKFARSGGRCVEVAPGSRDDFQALREVIRAEWTRVVGVVDLWNLAAEGSVSPSGEEILTASELAWGSALNLAKILPLQEDSPPPRLWLVTRGAQPAEEGTTLSGLIQSPVWGLAKVIAMENPELNCTCIDLDSQAPDGGAETLAQEIWSGGPEDQIAWRGHRRYVARLTRSTANTGNAQQAAHNPARARHAGELDIVQSAAGDRSVQFRRQATYLITGGLGGLGRTVARWMVERGAGRIVLVGRSGPDDTVRAELEQLRDLGADIVVARADISDSGQLARALAETQREDFPLRGIVHSAGVLDDALLTQQDRERFVRVMAPKVAGAWNLHHQTLDCHLDLFVLFSSLASLFGSPGQANHSAANAFLDAIAHYRRTLGLPALSINWGAWARVGSAADVTATNPLFKGLEAMEPDQGIWLMEQLLIRDSSQAGALPLGGSLVGSRIAARPLLAEMRETSNQSREAAGGFRQRLQVAPPKDRIALLTAFVRTQLINVLGLDTASSVDSQQGLFDLGLDSLTAVEFRNRIQDGLNCTLSSTLAFNYPSIDAVVTHLRQTMLDIEIPMPEMGSTGPQPAAEADVLLEADLDGLSEQELRQLLEEELGEIRQGV
ncbi:MAG TPA: SDR family NAD(P)-dependent oxidoreductase, partial [Opitutaceae bacterium]